MPAVVGFLNGLGPQVENGIDAFRPSQPDRLVSEGLNHPVEA
jgi:hypothetical protein